MENFVLNTIVAFCKERKFQILKGEYIATVKNEMVKNHYLNLGFTEKISFWELDINKHNTKNTFILKK